MDVFTNFSMAPAPEVRTFMFAFLLRDSHLRFSLRLGGLLRELSYFIE